MTGSNQTQSEILVRRADRFQAVSMRIRREVNQALIFVVLVFFLLLAVVPFFISVLAAFKTDAEMARGVFTLPDVWQWSNFARAWTQAHFALYFKSSLLVSFSVLAASTPLAIMSGYAFARLRVPFAGLIFGLLLLGMMVPQESYIIPLYYNLRQLGLTDTYWALILPQVAMSMSFGTFWMRGCFAGMPRDLVDAARVDGCNEWATLWRVLVPIAQPSILTMVVLFFVWTWNDFLLALVMVTKDSLRTLPLGLASFQGQHVADITLTAAGATIVALPTLLIYFIFQRQFIRGITGGAVKG